MYKLIGADGRQYGPVSAEVVRDWIRQGRAGAQTQAQAEGAAEWQPLSAFPEFAEALAAQAPPPSGAPPPSAGATPPPAGAPPPPAGTAPPLPGKVDPAALAGEILARDYSLDIGGCLGRAWRLLSADFWPIIGVSALVLLLVSLASGAMVGIVVAGPLMGGLFGYYFKKLRGQKADLNDAFAGFSLAFLPLLLGALISGLLTALGTLLCLLPGIYLGVAWMFTLPLIIDQRLEFWDAMEVSRKVISRHWWSFFGLALVNALLNLGGFLLCCVGWLVTTPWTMLAIACAYEDIFHPSGPPAA